MMRFWKLTALAITAVALASCSSGRDTEPDPLDAMRECMEECVGAYDGGVRTLYCQDSCIASDESGDKVKRAFLACAKDCLVKNVNKADAVNRCTDGCGR